MEDRRPIRTGCNFNTRPDDRRIVRTDRGQSESIGAMLLVAIVVIAVAVVAGALFMSSSPTEHPNVRIEATANGSELLVEHRAGEPIHENEFEIVLRETGTTMSGVAGQPREPASDKDGVFEPSEVWMFDADYSISEGESVLLVYTGGDRVLLDETAVEIPTQDDDNDELPSGTVAYDDENGNGLFDRGEQTYERDDFVNENFGEDVDLVVQRDLSNVDGKLQLKPTSVTVKSGVELSTTNNFNIDMDVSDSISVTGATIDASGDATLDGQRVDAERVDLTAEGKIELLSFHDIDVSDATLSASENANVKVESDENVELADATLHGKDILVTAKKAENIVKDINKKIFN
ncbi:hypothetical protein HLASF_1715 [Halanaeroarchaeum sulfurireducens]|uniref:Archaeal Type IV pilin N-terminal domain-containing protein n=1 Tax=Halanaeroarchaeum sulfurireducens TaxID=1604004 RepID=A0A0F7PDD7_9EURY|nr:hypothetical protein HLASF_1715 [Halanaeroarchaeum sulfurireducens]ALG82584.1 hypothetical protein HLASA_1702 [Halanaeroarchaeum sulfurireducens]